MRLNRLWRVLLGLCVAGGALASTCLAQDARRIDTEKSTMTVRVFKSGFFSAFAHDHEISAPIAEGRFSETQPSVELTVHARELRVVDREVSEKDRATIQQTMLGPSVLNAQEFAEIRYRSSAVQKSGSDKWIILGDLSLHGQTRPVKVEVEGKEGHYRGKATVLQKEFGIEPVRVAGGTVRVKNEVEVEFDIVAEK